MKLTTLMLFLVFMQVSASIRAQKVTLSERNVSLTTIFEQIRNQTGYDFAYTTTTINAAKPVTINVKNADLNQVLDKIFSGQPLNYTIENKSVEVSIKETSLFDKLSDKVKATLKLPADIGGTVTDTLDNPIAGASVSIKGVNVASLTDSKGNFNFPGMAQGKYTLVVSYVGYEKSELTIINTGTNSRVGLVLRQSISQLDQVRVIAYGTESRRFSVGSVSTITAEDIEKQPVNNVLLALEGKVTGLNIIATNGVPGSQVKVQVRGQNTLLSNLGQRYAPYDQPLFIIDGVPFAPQNANVNQLGSLGQSSNSNPSGVSPFSSINPSDVESITVLKDADATSIYGTQGSNGVILITTKKGKPGKTNVNVSVNTGYNTETDAVKLLNTQQYLQLRNEAFKNDGFTPNTNPFDPGYAPDLTIFDQNRYTNWEKTIFGNTSNNRDVHASVTGGSVGTTFLISGGYTVADYNFPGNFSNNRSTLHSTLNHTSPDNRFTITFGADYSYFHNNSSNFGSTTKILLPPNSPNLLDPAGGLLWNYKGVDLSNYQFYSYLKQPNALENYNLNNSLHLAYKLATGLSFSANLGYSRNNSTENQQNPASSQSPQYASSYSYFANSTYQTINIEPQLDYSRKIGKGDLTMLIGSTYKKDLINSNLLYGYNYANDSLLGSINGASNTSTSDALTIYRYSAVFGRIKYIYDQKYIISFTGRRDGSSNFGPGHQFGDFGSAGLGWIFSEEEAFKNTLPFVSYGKLSGNYGTSGSDGISSYLYQPFWQPNIYAPSFQNIKPFTPGNLYNPDYSWALKKSLNVALDLGFFHNKLLLNAAYYKSREGNQLVNYTLPSQTGFPSVLENLNATVQNTGWEISLSSTNVKTKNFSWTSSFNISANRNKLLAFPGLASSSYATYYTIGQPTSEVMGYKYKDVNPTTGVFEFYTAKGQPTYTPDYRAASLGGDQVPIANLAPKFFGGFGNDFNYKNFSLSVFFQFSKQTAANYLSGLYSFSTIPGTLSNEPVQILGNYWKNPGDQSKLERLTSSTYSAAGNASGYFIQSSGAYSDDTYLRLKTVSISYTLTDAYLKRLGVSNLRIYIRGQNVLTFTDYKVGDPEQPGSFADGFPLQRTLICGLSFNF